VQPAERARRLCFVRGFACYRSATDPFTEVPSPDLMPYRSSRARPYLYTEQEVQGLLEAALQLPTTWPSTPLRPWVFHCLLGLLRVTGLRISEALDLKLDDVRLGYLGRVYVAGTYWYLSNWPELMARAMARLERRWGESS
jgi:integrase/recombinase XerD